MFSMKQVAQFPFIHSLETVREVFLETAPSACSVPWPPSTSDTWKLLIGRSKSFLAHRPWNSVHKELLWHRAILCKLTPVQSHQKPMDLNCSNSSQACTVNEEQFQFPIKCGHACCRCVMASRIAHIWSHLIGEEKSHFGFLKFGLRQH